MLRLRPVLRCVPATSHIFSSAKLSMEPAKVDKAALKELRSRTGYSFINCRKALIQFGSERLDEAEIWLRDLAEKEGWQKAATLSSRPTKHGLVAAIAEGNRAALVEVNCETDFAARNGQFKKLVEKVALASIASAKAFDPMPDEKVSLIFKDFDSLNLTDGTPAKDALRETITMLGENVVVPPLTLVLSQPEVSLWGYAHPPEGTEAIHMGKFASVVGLEKTREDEFPIAQLGRQICQHIVGMKAETLGSPPEVGIEPPKSTETERTTEDGENPEEEILVTQIDEKETALLRQGFMLNPSQTVFEYVKGHGANIVDFCRIEIGEKAASKAK